MPPIDTAVIVLASIASLAALVNGALGYGFSSLTVPVALVFYANRVLNPALVLIEVFVNLYVLFINRSGVPAVWKRVFPILIGLLPGIGIGAWALASLQPVWISSPPIRSSCPSSCCRPRAGGGRSGRDGRSACPWHGAGRPLLGDDHSGPPLALLFNNQGLVKDQFRAGLALVRVAKSCLTATDYSLGLFIAESTSLLWVLAPCAAIGIPLGAYLLRRMDAETFRRICMSFDAWVVGFGLSRVLVELNLMTSPSAYSVMAAAVLIDIALLYVFFSARRTHPSDQQVLVR